jgi:hypothetical protein
MELIIPAAFLRLRVMHVTPPLPAARASRCQRRNAGLRSDDRPYPHLGRVRRTDLRRRACRQSKKVTTFKSLQGKSLAVATSSFVLAVAPCCLHV